ncbi:MAG: hypothetical protein ACUVQM_03075 [Candidatus Hadarchaeaceae archaeon]
MTIDIWIEIFLVAVILILVGWILYSGGGARQRKLQQEIEAQREELRVLREANESLRNVLGLSDEGKLRRHQELFQFIRDLESLRGAIAGSTVSQRVLRSKYGNVEGYELLKRIMDVRPNIDLEVKRRIADEILVGEAGRTIMKALDKGASIERAASAAGMPLIVAKGQIRRLQMLDYLDSRLKPTELGHKAME